MNLTIELVDAEIARLTRQYRNELQSAARDIEATIASLPLDGKGVSHHLGFNLGGRASEIQMLAGQIETMQAVRRSL